MSDSLPGYDAWKTDAPDWESAEEEAEAIRKNEELRIEFAEDLKAFIHDHRGDLFLSELWGIARDVLMKTERTAGEPAWQTRPTRWPDPDVAEAAPRALKLFMERMSRFGDWDDGCFYYNRTSASELEEPIKAARAALAKAEGGAG
jgi:hypothetical protein